jgi:hypothetical protein
MSRFSAVISTGVRLSTLGKKVRGRPMVEGSQGSFDGPWRHFAGSSTRERKGILDTTGSRDALSKSLPLWLQ